ncbi:aminoglycoside 3'-phosphotransferase [Kribbella sp. CA-293567]|uniref:aminoglycoside 3'-phosphotransferase n=1 Tax=Kribbella sp. CA-293567 TaxID=3002436 RepID=UPI0022DE13D5|nr:aminoglycoside 3'-phosphotransferase [Kribbella sp. CA-293567]WBQ04311.1 aminoglycoside 3'-phosphotransferase [Kribbella sp. CA-293567]
MELPGGGWELVKAGESATSVHRRGAVFAKTCGPDGVAELLAERDRAEWLASTSVPGARVLDWIESAEGAALLTSAVPGVTAGDLPWSEKLVASLARAVRAVHELPVESCPFERRLVDVVAQAEDVVRRGAVNPDFLTDDARLVAPEELLARVRAALPAVQAAQELVVCHGDACLPNFLFDPDTLEWTGTIDVGRLGVADRYSDLALVKAQLEDEWSVDAAAFFAAYGVVEPDAERLAFHLLLDALTWG